MTDREFDEFIEEQTGRYLDFLEALTADLRAGTARAKHGDAFDRRNLIRTFFTLVEGDTFYRKRLALMVHDTTLSLAEPPHAVFSPQELMLLQDLSPELSTKGTVRVSQKFLRLSDNVRFSFAAAAKAFGADFQLDVAREGWQAFRNALDVRHRLTHPKSIDDLEVTERDLLNLAVAVKWYFESLADLFGWPRTALPIAVNVTE